MRMTWLCQMTWLLVVALLSLGAVAHAESAIVGTVFSAEDKKPIPDVVVTATSPVLQSEQVVVTDEQNTSAVPRKSPPRALA